MTWQAKHITKLTAFAKGKRILEIGGGAFATSLALARLHPAKTFVSLDFTLSPAALSNLASIPSNLSILKHDARGLELLQEGYFDFAFSIAVMEHVHELALHLDEMHRVLRPGGHYWFWEAPFWSSSMGHHYKHSDPMCPVPPYGHLYLTRDELGNQMKANGQPASEIDAALARIYERGDLSRLSRTETRGIVKNSQFKLLGWDDDKDQYHSPAVAKRVVERNLFNIKPDDLKYKGARVLLKKPGSLFTGGEVAGRRRVSQLVKAARRTLTRLSAQKNRAL